MLTALANIFIVLFLLVALLFEAAIIWRKHSRRAQARKHRLCENYIHQITKIVLTGQYGDICPHADSSLQRTALAEAMYVVVSHCYNANLTILRHIVYEHNLDHFILHQITRQRGLRQARMLMLMSAVPTGRHISRHISPHIASRNPHIRTSALLALLAATPTAAISTIASLPYALQPYDIARIMLLLRRGIVSIAHEPLLNNENNNLKMLGMAIVSNFGIEIADKALRRIIVATYEPLVVREAIYTLCAIGHSPCSGKVRLRICTLPHHRRKELCRHLAREGYSSAAIHNISSDEESPYYDELIKSYKSSLGC